MAEPDSRTPSSPLHDIRVVDLTTARGQLCGRVLADLGAEVLLIEPPSGLAARRVGPFAPDGRSLFFESFARGKASVALDLVADREAVLELIDKADIVLESSGPGELVALGYGFAELSDRPGRERPLVYTSITPFGQSGPHAGNPATDLTIEAAAGQVAMQGTGARSPIPVSVPLASLNGSVQAAADTLMALRHRDRVGVGQHLDTSMQAAMVWSTMSASGFFPVDGRDAPQSDQRRTRGPRDIAPGTTLPLIERCADGWVYLTMPILGRVSTDSFAALMAWLHEEAPMPKVVAEVDWGMWLINLFGGKVGGDEIASGIALLREFLATKTKQEIHSRALQDRILMAPLNDAADLLADPHLVERGLWTGLGEAQRVGTWAHLSATPMQPGTTAPEIGSSRNGWGPSIVAATPLRKESAVPDDGGGIFGDLKVADFSWAAAGPVITRTLADHGATVVKVESQARPDNMRFMGPFKDAKRGTDRSFPAANMNVSKLGLALDFSSDDGRQVAAELIDWADVVVENFAPGVMDRLGFGYEELAVCRPDLIMVSTSLRGQTGGERLYTGFGGQGAALSGFTLLTGWPDLPPDGPWGAYTDFVAPRFALTALAAAVRHRDLTGQGQLIDIAQTEAPICFLEPEALDAAFNGVVAGRLGDRSSRFAPQGVFAVSGVERYVAIGVETDEQWCSLAELVGIDSGSDRRAEHDLIDEAIEAWTSTREATEAVDLLIAAGVPAALVARSSDLHNDPQLEHRCFFAHLDHPTLGVTPFDGQATVFSATPAVLRHAGPLPGADNEFVLRELLGYDQSRIAQLAAAGILS